VGTTVTSMFPSTLEVHPIMSSFLRAVSWICTVYGMDAHARLAKTEAGVLNLGQTVPNTRFALFES